MTPKAAPHLPVMLEEVLEHLAPTSGKRYIDATLGAGGHTLAILKSGATVDGIDHDQQVIDVASSLIKEAGLSKNFTAHQGSFADILEGPELGDDYDGILFDLGVSSLQLDTPDRGFSFRFDAPLDMRMDQEGQAVTAADLVNGLGRKELVKLFRDLSEERYATLLADAICDARKLKPIKTTFDLVAVIESHVKRTGRLHPATRVFQSLRMAVNTERDELKAALPSALSKLVLGGTLVVISFHSGEGLIIKDTIKKWVQEEKVSKLKGSPFTPSDKEVSANPRSRSAVMSVVRRTS